MQKGQAIFGTVMRTVICFVLGLMIVCLVAYAIAYKEGVTVKESGYTGIIFPSHSLASLLLSKRYHTESSWTPTPHDVENAEKSISLTLVRMKNDPACTEYLRSEIQKIIVELPTYRRQYFGLVIDGKKKVFCNFFPGSSQERSDSFPNWKIDYVEVCDGGCDFWSIFYDLETGSCEHLEVNGYA